MAKKWAAKPEQQAAKHQQEARGMFDLETNHNRLKKW
jgi:hypothetical protein